MLTDHTSTLTRTLRYVHNFLSGIFFLFLLFLVTNNFVFTSYTVNGHSMEPTLHNNQHLGISLVSYLWEPPKAGDVVILSYIDNRNVHFVKRITGTPGEQVNWQGKLLTLKENQFFVEGDNRDHSTDSRVFGPIEGRQIIGKVVIPWGLPEYAGQ